MESWTYPSAYDENYFPDAASRYWFPDRETMGQTARDAAILQRLRQICRHAYENSGFYRRKWSEANFHPDHLRSLEDFEERVPVITKEELRASQGSSPPFGDYLCVPPSEVARIHGTSGTTGRPTAFAIGRNDWRAIANAHARIMWGMGIRPGDMIFVAAIFSLYIGSWGALAGAERLHAQALPFGAGVPGMTARCAEWLATFRPAGFYSTPSYALHLAEVAVREGFDPRAFGLGVMFFSGEPGASIPAIRDRIVDLYGARIIDCGSMAEMTPWMHLAGSAESDGMLCWQDIVYTEVCDPATMRRVSYGQRGTPVYTHLERTSQPMIRLLSGDLALWVNDAAPCGRTYPRLPHGILGRIDDMFTIRGENVYPSQIDAALNELDEYGGEHRIVISRETVMDELLVKVEMVPAVSSAGTERIEAFRRHVSEKLQKILGVRTIVEVAAPGSLPRTSFKARRIVDDRTVFRELVSRLELGSRR